MVLEDSVNDPPTSDAFSELDPYSEPQYSSESGSRLAVYHVANVPQPNALFGAISGINNAVIASAVTSKLENASRILHRQLTQSETEALTQHCAAGFVTASYGKPLGYAVGLYRAYSTRQTYRFPFRTPDPKTFDPTRFTILGITLFEGQQSRIIWHGLRCTSYGVGMAYLGHLVFGLSGAWKIAVGEATDNRLNDFSKAQKEAMKNTMAGERMERMKRAGSIDNKDAGEVLRRSRAQQTQDERQRSGMERIETVSTPDWDDASPSAVGWSDTVSEPAGGDSSFPSDASPDAYSGNRTPVQRQPNSNTRQRSRQEADQERSSSSADSLLSDLGTPGSDTPGTPSSPNGKGSSSESAWARIRRGNAPSDSDSGFS